MPGLSGDDRSVTVALLQWPIWLDTGDSGTDASVSDDTYIGGPL